MMSNDDDVVDDADADDADDADEMYALILLFIVGRAMHLQW